MSVDDHPLIREGIGTIITGQTDMSLAGTASNGRERIEAFRSLRPDVRERFHRVAVEARDAPALARARQVAAGQDW